MASLKKRLEKSEYQRWVKAAICLSHVKSGLEVFAEERSKRTHGFVKAALNNNKSSKKLCCHAKRPEKKEWTLGCCTDCEIYLKELKKFQVSHFKFDKYNWQNSDIQLWPTNAWEMVKVFMNRGQMSFQKNSKQTDLSGLINFIDHCSVPHTDIQNRENISKVRKSRNKIMHSALMTLTEKDFEDCTTAMIDLLEDPLFMCEIPEAKKHAAEIKEIQKDSYKIGKIEEFEVLTETMTEMKTQNEQLKEEVKQMKQSIEKESEEIRSMLKEEARQREMKISEVKKEIDDKEQKIEKLTTDLLLIKKLLYEDRELREKMDFRVTNVEDSLNKTNFEFKHVKRDFHILTDQVQELLKNIEPSKPTEVQKSTDEEFLSLKQKNEELEKQVETFNRMVTGEITGAYQKNIELEELRSENIELQRNENILCQDLQAEKCRSKDLEKKYNEVKQKYEQLQKLQATNNESETERKLRECQKRNAALEFDNDNLKRSDESRKAMEKELYDFERRNNALESDLEKVNRELEELQEHKQEHIDMKDELCKQNQDLTIQAEEKQKEIQTLQERLTMLELDLEKANRKVEERKQEHTDMKDALQKKIQDFTIQVEEKSKENQSLLERQKMLELDLKNANHEVEERKQEHTDMKDALQKQLQDLTIQAEKKSKEIQNLLERQKMLELDLKNANHKVEELQECKQEYMNTQNMLELKLNESNIEVNRLSKELENVKNQRNKSSEAELDDEYKHM